MRPAASSGGPHPAPSSARVKPEPEKRQADPADQLNAIGTFGFLDEPTWLQ
jgi:hypothetical protein